MNLNDLETFVLVAEAGTFSGAAAQLGVPKSTVSRRVARLEAELGVALLHRAARSIALSDDGRALVARCAPALREIAEVERGLGDARRAPRGRLKVTAPIDIAHSEYVSTLLAEYRARYPGVTIRLEVTNRFVDLLEEGFDVAFRVHSGSSPSSDDLIARRLAAVKIGLYSSPSYLDVRGVPAQWGDLADHSIVSHSRAFRGQWPTEPAIETDDYGPAAAVLAAGGGIGAIPGFVASPYLATGELVPLDLECESPASHLALVWLRSRHLAPRVRAFIDMAAERAATGDSFK